MYGAEGAVTLFVIRQGVALARTAIRVGVIAGQVELGKARPLPPLARQSRSEEAELILDLLALENSGSSFVRSASTASCSLASRCVYHSR